MGKFAARLTDMHTCPMITPGVPPIPHVGGPIIGPGVPTVLIGSLPAAVLGDMCMCVGPPDSIILGSFGVTIMKKPAARMGDTTAHGGTIVLGLPTVMIGDISPGGPVGPVVVAPVNVMLDAANDTAPGTGNEAAHTAAMNEAAVSGASGVEPSNVPVEKPVMPENPAPQAKNNTPVQNTNNDTNTATPALRAAYEAEVKGLASMAEDMRKEEKSSEEIAIAMHKARRDLGIKYKNLTPPAKLEEIYARNEAKHGDKLGPTIDYLRSQGKSWDDIIESSTRSGGRDINFNK